MKKILLKALLFGCPLGSIAQIDTQVRIVIADTRKLLSDTCFLALYTEKIDHFFADRLLPAVRDNHNRFVFTIDHALHPGHLALADGMTQEGALRAFVRDALFEPGDNVVVTVDNTQAKAPTVFMNTPSAYGGLAHRDLTFTFTGHGALKYQLVSDISRQIAEDHTATQPLDKNNQWLDNTHVDAAEKIAFSTLDAYRAGLSPLAYNTLKADFFGMMELERIYWLRMFNSKIIREPVQKMRMAGLLQARIDDPAWRFPEAAQHLSGNYARLLAESFLVDRKTSAGYIDTAVAQIQQRYQGLLRDRVLTCMAIRLARDSQSPALVERIAGELGSAACSLELNDFVSQNAVGRPAFDFSLPDRQGKTISLSSFRGKVVVMDFWYKGCGSCSHFYQHTLSAVERHYRLDSTVVFITVSIDKDRSTWLSALDSGQYTSADVINLCTGGPGINAPIIRAYRVMGYPRPLVIDKSGRIFCNDQARLQSGYDPLCAVIDAALRQL